MTDALFEPSPFASPGQWIKTALHFHTSNSDGGLSPEDAVKLHRSMGYKCVGITDHSKVTPAHIFTDENFVGIDSTENGGQPDVVGIGVKKAVPRNLSFNDRVTGLAQQGGFTIGAHPRHGAVTPETYVNCRDLMAMEICNAYCDMFYANGIATELWDMVLGQGKRLWGVASDDAHLKPKWDCFSKAGQGWVEVWAEELSAKAIMSALKGGAFYSTRGPTFKSICVESSTITVETSPVAQIRWRTFGRIGYVAYPAEGASCLTQSTLGIVHDPKQQDCKNIMEFAARTFVRIELIDHNGKEAWSNPFFLEPTCD